MYVHLGSLLCRSLSLPLSVPLSFSLPLPPPPLSLPLCPSLSLPLSLSPTCRILYNNVLHYITNYICTTATTCTSCWLTSLLHSYWVTKQAFILLWETCNEKSIFTYPLHTSVGVGRSVYSVRGIISPPTNLIELLWCIFVIILCRKVIWP